MDGTFPVHSRLGAPFARPGIDSSHRSSATSHRLGATRSTTPALWRPSRSRRRGQSGATRLAADSCFALTLRSSSTQGPTRRPSTTSERVAMIRSTLIRNTCCPPALPAFTARSRPKTPNRWPRDSVKVNLPAIAGRCHQEQLARRASFLPMLAGFASNMSTR